MAVPAWTVVAWQEVHWVLALRLPDCQLGVVWPPWQLTLLQVRRDGLKAMLPPVLATKVESMDTVAGPVGVAIRASALR